MCNQRLGNQLCGCRAFSSDDLVRGLLYAGDMKRSSLVLITLLSVSACVANPSHEEGDDESLDGKADDANPIENVHAYDDCLVHGTSTSMISLGMLGFRDSATTSGFVVVECITGHLSAADPQMRPYNLQSLKKSAIQTNGGGRQVYFLKRGTTATSTNEPRCLKVKLFATVGATDVLVTIERVKQLPPPRADGLCADNGET
jgi:hypothetical protein